MQSNSKKKKTLMKLGFRIEMWMEFYGNMRLNLKKEAANWNILQSFKSVKVEKLEQSDRNVTRTSQRFRSRLQKKKKREKNNVRNKIPDRKKWLCTRLMREV